MGFVEGQSLSQRLAGGPLPPREAAALMVKVAEAIDYAHQHGVIHRDIKPANILIDAQGNPRVTDFGLAKKVKGDNGLTGSGQIMGTPSHMPPEQAGGHRGEVGPLADVYALGATLYALVTGRPPFQAATAMDTVLQVIGEEPVPPRRLNPAVDRDVETICLKCLEKEPKRRYVSSRAFAEDLERYLLGQPIHARPVGRLEAAMKWSRRYPAVATWVGISPILLLQDSVNAVLAGAAAAAMAFPRRRHPVAVALVAVAFGFYGFYSDPRLAREFEIGPLLLPIILPAIQGALSTIAITSLWPLGRDRKPMVPVLLSLCTAMMILSELVNRAWPWIRENPPRGQFHGAMNSLFAVVDNLEHISIALLMGLGIGLLCRDLLRRFSAALRGDPAVTVFGAMVGVLGVMSFIPTKAVIGLVFSLMISGAVNPVPASDHGRWPQPLVPTDYDRLILPLPPTDRFVLEILFKALFIGLGATLGGLIGALSSREGARSPGRSRPPPMSD
jgi:hypothetical protein